MLITACVTLAFAQVPDTLWSKTYGGSQTDESWSALQTFDGSHILVGRTNSFGVGEFDIYLIKTDSMGNEIWYNTYGGPDNDVSYSIVQSSDSGFVFVGGTSSFGNTPGLLLLKTNKDGDTLWSKVYCQLDYAYGRGISQIGDGGYIIAGSSSDTSGTSGGWLLRIDEYGDTLWTRLYGMFSNYAFNYACETSDGGYIITGTIGVTSSDWDVIIMKTDSNGDSLWTFIYGGDAWDKGNYIVETEDFHYLVTGWTYSYGPGVHNIYILKFTANGDTVWTKIYGGNYYSCAYSIQKTSDGSYILGGSRSINYTNMDAYLFKVDANCDSVWACRIGGIYNDYGWYAQQTTDNGYILAGYTESYGAGMSDAYLIKFNSEGYVSDNKTNIIKKSDITATIFRGPLVLPKDKKCKVFDITGREVKPHLIAPGIYFIEIDGKITQKVIKVK